MEVTVYNADARFTPVLEAYKRALESNPNLLYNEFCRNHDVNFNSFRHWLERKGISVRKLRTEAHRRCFPEHYTISEEFAGKQPSEIYEQIWLEYRQALKEDRSMPLSRFCRRRGVNASRMLKWMRRESLSVFDLKLELGLGEDLGDYSAAAKKRFRVVLREYKKLLIEDPNLPFDRYCRSTHTDANAIKRWMSYNGITIKMLKAAAREQARLPKNVPSVSVQFRPNGGSVSDKLHDVIIQLPNGTLLSMETCSVVELCSFVVAYNTSSPEFATDDN